MKATTGFFETSDPCWLVGAMRHPIRGRVVDVIGTGLLSDTVAAELDAIGTADVSRALRNHSDLVVGTLDEIRAARVHVADLRELEALCQDLCDEGFAVYSTSARLYVTGRSDRALLYGYYRLLREPELEPGLRVVENPARSIRMLNHWDNMVADDPMGSVERGYSGRSIFFKDGAVVEDRGRLIDYARLLASVGINALALNNVNVHDVESRLLIDGLDDVAALAAIFRRFGISLFASVDFAAPIRVGGLDTADPLDPDVQAWWWGFTQSVFRAIPDFGGYVVKADSEGRPGPFDYGRGHSDGANMMAKALRPHGATVFWRCFVYNSRQDWRDRSTDRARAAFDHFLPLDGAFDDNVILQVKSGPMDFQVREPVSPLIGALTRTNLVVELQITQEYTGHQIDLFYLPRTWQDILRFDFGDDQVSDSDTRTVGEIVSDGHAEGRRAGLVAVSNVGSDWNWTGHKLAQANLYGFGRMCWSDEVSADQILTEWIRLTFDLAGEPQRALHQMMYASPEVYENYTAPLGVGWMVTPHTHYGPSVDGYEYSRWGTYHFADHRGVGVDRASGSGTGFAAQYPAPWAERYEDLERCPDELLLFFHHVPYSHVLRSGRTVIQHIYDTHFLGVEQVEGMLRTWEALRAWIDPQTHEQVASRFAGQLENAREWRDQVCTYFYRKADIGDVLGRRIY